MPSRFSNRPHRSIPTGTEAASGDGIGEWWAGIAVIGLITTAIVSLMGSADPRTGAELAIDTGPRILEVLDPAQRSLNAVESAFESLCQEPVLLALELEPNCESGVMTLSDELFEGFGKAQLGPVAQEDVVAAMTTYLSRLRKLPAIWESLDAIEIRGHTDPRAVRDPYATNLVGSQQRALGVLLFLVGPDGLSESDRIELQRLAVVSGVSFSRPPATCPERDPKCYTEWRRVEIRPVLSESLRRDDWSRTVQDARQAALSKPTRNSARNNNSK
jgi:outer membrane protein OmpA-like peptidoglycan-associated protein